MGWETKILSQFLISLLSEAVKIQVLQREVAVSYQNMGLFHHDDNRNRVHQPKSFDIEYNTMEMPTSGGSKHE